MVNVQGPKSRPYLATPSNMPRSEALDVSTNKMTLRVCATLIAYHEETKLQHSDAWLRQVIAKLKNKSKSRNSHLLNLVKGLDYEELEV